ncbi:MAG: TIGR00296 family protein [Anaerolineae bacterium]
MEQEYTPQEQAILLRLAREALADAAAGREVRLPDLGQLPRSLREPRACFITLNTQDGHLRGCTGTLEARRPLAHEVPIMTHQTALHDPRFAPVTPPEVPGLHIEISVLTPPRPLHFEDPREIPHLLRPGRDGVVLVVGGRRATLLPQVWERLPDVHEFLDMLCYKMGLPAGSWQRPDVQVFTYESIAIEEPVPSS